MHRCNKCGSMVQDGDAFCKACGEPQNQVPGTKSSGMRHCPNCGASVTEDMSFCTSCGQRLTGDIPSDTTKVTPESTPVPMPASAPGGEPKQLPANSGSEPQGSKKKIVIIVAAVVAVVLIVVAALAFNMHRSSKPSSNGGNPGTTSQSGKSSNSDDLKTYGLSQLLKGDQTIWFVSEEAPTKTTAPYALVFDKGKVTEYGAQYGEYRAFNYSALKGVKSSQLLQKLKQLDQKNFENAIKMDINELQQRLDSVQKEAQSNDAYCAAVADINFPSDNSVSKADPGCKREIADVKTSIAKLKTLKYQAPKPGTYRLTLETDDTGNATKLEHVWIDAGYLGIEQKTLSTDTYGSYASPYDGGDQEPKHPVDAYSLTWAKGENDLKLSGMARPYRVYDKTYDGLCYSVPDDGAKAFMLQMAPDGKSLPTRVMLDQPGAKGVKIVS